MQKIDLLKKLKNYIALICPFLIFFENWFNPVAFDPFTISKSLLCTILLKWLYASLRLLNTLPFLFFDKELATLINRSDIDKVFVYGKYIRETFNSLVKNKKGKIFNNLKEAYDHFSKIVHNNDLLMVKGSNATGLNQFSKNIKKGQISAI